MGRGRCLLMSEACVFCHTELEPDQEVLFSNESCMFLQLKQYQTKGKQLEGSRLIVPREHRETVFDLTEEEWNLSYRLLHEVKTYIDDKHNPQGYNLGWNSGEVGGQHIFHAHFHVMPRYEDEPLAGKGIRYLFKKENNGRNS